MLAEVPPFHPLAVKLMKLAADPWCSLARVVELLRSDAVFTAEVLRMANSAFFGCRGEVTNVLHAVAVLGLDRINTIVATTAARSLVDRRRPLTHSCWRHNLATALFCQNLSSWVNLEPERCYVAGLIHDIGRLALLRVFPEYERAMRAAETPGSEVLTVERELFGTDHAEAGRWLLSQWGCPMELQNVAAFHEHPPAPPAEDSSLIRLVYAGAKLADLARLSVLPSEAQAELPEILSVFPDRAQPILLASFPEMADWVVVRINEIEVSLRC
jgi:HD-like signal output (HDOD) protein